MNKQRGGENYWVKLIFMLCDFGQRGYEGEYASTDFIKEKICSCFVKGCPIIAYKRTRQC